MEKVFITGADGMLGASMCRECLKQGFSVRAMTLPGRVVHVLDGLDIERVEGNILDKAFLDGAMAGCDYVIHVAASTTVWPRRMKSIVEVNVEGTKNVAAAARKHLVKRMVHIGTANSFGHGSKEHPGNELSAFSFGTFKLDYIDSKLCIQKELLRMHKEEDFPVVIINPTYMIGPFDSGPSSGKMVLELLKGNMPGYSLGGKNFVCSFDVAVAAVNALKMGQTGQCYIAGNENLNYKEFFMKVCEVGNIKFKLIKVPAFLVLGLGLFNSVLARILGKAPRISYTMARMSGVSQYYDSTKARKELNMPQTPIKEGIALCVNWFKTNGYL